MYSVNHILVGSFNPSEKYSSNWMISPGRGKNKKCLKPPPSIYKQPMVIWGFAHYPRFSDSISWYSTLSSRHIWSRKKAAEFSDAMTALGGRGG